MSSTTYTPAGYGTERVNPEQGLAASENSLGAATVYWHSMDRLWPYLLMILAVRV